MTTQQSDVLPLAELRRHETRMLIASQAARSGSSCGMGGPFGCAIIRHGQIIAVAHNTVLGDKNPTCHAEMNAIRMACKSLKTHDLSDCDLYTTCEPCPMCWGALYWARIGRMFIGIDRADAAEFGWSDEFFYTELGKPSIERSIRTTQATRDETKSLLDDLFHSNPTSNRRMKIGGNYLKKIYASIFNNEDEPKTALVNNASEIDESSLIDDQFMREAIRLAHSGMRTGQNKEREPFGTVIVKDGYIIGRGYNKVLLDYDPTATSEIVAITDACKAMSSHDLTGCEMFSTGEPDVMSMGAIYWANIKRVHIGYSLADSASAGFEDGLIHYVELNDSSDKILKVHRNVAFEECRQVFIDYEAGKGSLY